MATPLVTVALAETQVSCPESLTPLPIIDEWFHDWVPTDLRTVAPIVSTPLRVQRLAGDGVTLQGSATTILDNEGISDEGIVEAPDLMHREGTWYLFFSANCYTNANYNVHYATATSVTGPYTRAKEPLFMTGDGNGLTAPGGADVDHDGRHMVFHAQNGNGGRALYTALLNFDGTTVSA
jgi:GH43 family beta-xylosidase